MFCGDDFLSRWNVASDRRLNVIHADQLHQLSLELVRRVASSPRKAEGDMRMASVSAHAEHLQRRPGDRLAIARPRGRERVIH
jgi:hypothetical protein